MGGEAWITREHDETLALEHRLAMADAVIYATARAHGATAVTSDAHLAHPSGVTLFAHAYETRLTTAARAWRTAHRHRHPQPGGARTGHPPRGA
jgi:hypothetical protein